VQEIRKYVESGDENGRQAKKFQKGIAYHQTYDEDEGIGYEDGGKQRILVLLFMIYILYIFLYIFVCFVLSVFDGSAVSLFSV
jgi:hypothetical protein